MLRNGEVKTARPCQTADLTVLGTTAAVTLISKQQPNLWDSPEQQGLCVTSGRLSDEVWQSGSSIGVMLANATTDPCRPRASIVINTMS